MKEKAVIICNGIHSSNELHFIKLHVLRSSLEITINYFDIEDLIS